jgi:hypothetical protein
LSAEVLELNSPGQLARIIEELLKISDICKNDFE